MTLLVKTDATFTAPGLPTVRTSYVQPIVGAIADFAADNLPLGSLSVWRSLVGSMAFQANAGVPTVEVVGGKNALRFDGVDDRVQLNWATSQPHSVIAVHKLNSPVGGEYVHFGTVAGQAHLAAGTTNYSAGVGTGGAALNPPVVPDTGWHVSILSVDGSSSSLNFDGTEYSIAGSTFTRQGVILGFGPSPSFRSNVSYRRFAIVPGTLTASQRAAIVETMRSAYNI